MDIQDQGLPAHDDRQSERRVGLGEYVPAGFLLWSVIGIFRPAFDASVQYNPIFWYVCGASLLTLYGRYVTRDVGTDERENEPEESLQEKWRFNLPPLLRAHKDASGPSTPRGSHP
jgi:hypothetical protein